MAASDHLNPQLFHGTNAVIPVGDVIQPATTHDKVAFATTSMDIALKHATKHGNDEAYVYKVEPVDDTEDLRMSEYGFSRIARSKNGFRVTGTAE